MADLSSHSVLWSPAAIKCLSLFSGSQALPFPQRNVLVPTLVTLRLMGEVRLKRKVESLKGGIQNEMRK